MECHALPPAAYVRPPPATPREMLIDRAHEEVSTYRQRVAEVEMVVLLTRGRDPEVVDHLRAVQFLLAGALDRFRRIAGGSVVERRPRAHVQGQR